MAITAIKAPGQPLHRSTSLPQMQYDGWTSSQSMVQPKQYSNATLRGMRLMVIIGQFCGLFNFRGTYNPRFTWLSIPAIYFYFSSTLCITSCIFIIQTTKSSVSDSKTFIVRYNGGILHKLTLLTLLLLFFRLSQRWNRVTQGFSRVERYMAIHGYPESKAGPYIRKLTIVLLSLTLIVEIFIDVIPPVMAAVRTSSPNQAEEVLHSFLCDTFPEMKDAPLFNDGVWILCLWTRVQSKIAITYNDLVPWALSIVVTAQLQSFKEKLEQSDFKTMTERDWLGERETYSKIVTLVDDLDQILGPHVIVAFGLGIWFNCGGVLLMFDGDLDFGKMVYVYASQTFWVFRLSMAIVSMARIREQQKNIKCVLELVPTSTYNDEIHQFTLQVSFDEVGFTGLKFFAVTRSALLTIVSTIGSYVIILMQFND